MPSRDWEKASASVPGLADQVLASHRVADQVTERSSGGGCAVFLVLIMIGFLWWIYSYSIWLFYLLIGLLFLFLVLYLLRPKSPIISEPETCEICGNPIGKTMACVYVNGESKKVCSLCAGNVRRKESKLAVDKLFEKPEPAKCPECGAELPPGSKGAIKCSGCGAESEIK